MQNIQLFTDISFLEDSKNPEINTCGASIVRFINKNKETKQLKTISLFSAQNSSYGELVFGALKLKKMLNEIITNEKNIIWFCDLPYISKLIADNYNSLEPYGENIFEIKNLVDDKRLSIYTPSQSKEKYYHSLCHRACSMARKQIEDKIISGEKSENILISLQSFLSKKSSVWKLTSFV